MEAAELPELWACHWSKAGAQEFATTIIVAKAILPMQVSRHPRVLEVSWIGWLHC